MIDELDTYALSDFLLFSKETYFRLFALYNEDVWPVHLLALAIGIALLWLVRRPDVASGRTVAALLAIMWMWIGWEFHLERYATINLAAPYFAALFGLEALLLIWIGVVRGGIRFARGDTIAARAGFIVIAFSILINPFIEILAGRQWIEVSLFGLGPDPTAMATAGAVLAARGKSRWLPMALALVWCVIALLTAIAMGSIEGVGPAIVIAVSIAVLLLRTWRAG